MKNEDAFFAGVFLTLVIMLVGSIFAYNQSNAKQDEAWSNGWCTAKSGVVITNQVCNVNDRLVTIPERP